MIYDNDVICLLHALFDKYLNFSIYNNPNANLITDKKSAICDNDDRSSYTASTCRTTIRKRKLQVKRNLFEDKKGNVNPIETITCMTCCVRTT